MEGLLSVIESVNNNSVKEKKDDDITTKTIIEDAAKLHAQRSSDIVQRSRKQNRVVRNYTEEHMTDSSSIPIKRSKRGRPHYEAQENILHHSMLCYDELSLACRSLQKPCSNLQIRVESP